jgi:hypothetical protein
VINTNVTGTLHLIQHVGRGMVAKGWSHPDHGSIAGFQPGAFHAVYNGSKAFIDSSRSPPQRAEGHRRHRELPDAAIDTEFFLRAGMDTKVANDPRKLMQPEDVARIGLRPCQGRSRRGGRPEEQVSGGPEQGDALAGQCAMASQAGGAGHHRAHRAEGTLTQGALAQTAEGPLMRPFSVSVRDQVTQVAEFEAATAQTELAALGLPAAVGQFHEKL